MVQSAELLAKFIAERQYPKDPVIITGDFNIITGDFNCTEDDDPIRYLTSANGPIRQVDTYRHVHLSDNDDKNSNNIVGQSSLSSEGTFHGWKGNTDGPRIDYIFVNEGIRILDAVILRNQPGNNEGTTKRFPSDHYPVMSHIEIHPESDN